MTTAIIIGAAFCVMAGLLVWALCRSTAEADACAPGPLFCDCGERMRWATCDVCFGASQMDARIPVCPQCDSRGGWWVCPACEPQETEEAPSWL